MSSWPSIWNILFSTGSEVFPGFKPQFSLNIFGLGKFIIHIILTPVTRERALAQEWFERWEGAGIEGLIAEHDLPAHTVAFGAKGCVTFSPTRVRNYRDYLEIDDDYSHLHWLFQHNGGAFMPPWGKSEQWTLSVQHTLDDAQRYVDNFRTFAEALVG